MEYSVTSGETSTGIVLNNDSMFVYSSGIANETTANFGGRLNVSSGGSANDTLINSGGRLNVFNGGLANRMQVNSGGSINISSGGTAVEILENGGYANVAADADATFTANAFHDLVLSNGAATVHSGTTALDTAVDSNGYLLVSSGGTVCDTAVNSRGALSVSSGGTALRTVLNGGYLSVFLGGQADITTVNSGGYLSVSSGGTAVEIVENGGFVNVVNGAHAVFASNTFTGLQLSNGSATLHSGTTALDLAVDSRGYLSVSGGHASRITVNPGGSLSISRGGIVTGIIENGGFVWTANGAEADFGANAFSGLQLSNGAATIHSGTTAFDTTAGPGGSVFVFSGGRASRITVDSGGSLSVSSGGTAAEISMIEGGKLVLTVASDTYIQGDYAGSAFEMKDAFISGYTVNPYGWLNVSSGGQAANTVIGQYGSMFVFSGGTADRTEVNSGRMYVSGGGIVSNTEVRSGGLFVYENGKVTGTIRIEAEAAVSAYTGSEINFDLTARTAADVSLINDLSRIAGDPSYTVTISASQAAGAYRLADGAADFSKTISISNTAGDTGSLIVGRSIMLGDNICTLDLDADTQSLSLSVVRRDTTPPVITSVTQNIYNVTDTEIILTIHASDEGGSGVDPTGYKYWDAGVWRWVDLPGNTLTVTENGDYTFAVYDNAGNVSAPYTHTVAIDLIPPVINSVTQDVDGWTNGDVVLTIHATDEGGSGVDPTSYKYWDATAGLWTDLRDNTLTVTQSGGYSFAVYDYARNVSAVYTHTVTNIDKIVPVITSVTQNNYNVTDTEIVLTIHAMDEGGSGVNATGYKYWDATAGLWADLPGNTLTVTQNGDYTFAVYDNAGNVSALYTHTVGNIMRLASADSPSFFPAGDNADDSTADGQEARIAGEEITGWVGFGDAADLIKFQLAGDGQIRMDLDGATAAAYQAGQAGLACLDAAGKPVELAAFDGGMLISEQAVAAGEDYLGVTCADGKNSNTAYGVTIGLLA